MTSERRRRRRGSVRLVVRADPGTVDPTGSLPARDPRALLYPTDRPRPSGQLPGGAPELGRRPARQGRLPRHRRPACAHDHRSAGRRRRDHPRSRGRAVRDRARPRRRHRVRAEPRARTLPTRMGDGVHGVVWRTEPDDPVQRQDGQARAPVRVGRPVHVSGPAGGRHPALRHQRGAGRRRSTTAHRDHP